MLPGSALWSERDGVVGAGGVAGGASVGPVVIVVVVVVVVTPVGTPARSTTSGAFEKADAEEDDAVAGAAGASEYESVTTGTRVGFAG